MKLGGRVVVFSKLCVSIGGGQRRQAKASPKAKPRFTLT